MRRNLLIAAIPLVLGAGCRTDSGSQKTKVEAVVGHGAEAGAGSVAVGGEIGGNGSSGVSAMKGAGGTISNSHAVNLSTTNSNDLMQILINANVPSAAVGVGASLRKADSIDCSEAVVPDPVPTCVIKWSNQTFPIKGNAAKSLYEILAANGAAYSDGAVGSSKLRSTAVYCGKPVVPNASAKCSFVVSGGPASAFADPNLSQKTLSGVSAGDVLAALVAAGITPPSGPSGTTYSADAISCGMPVIPNAQTTCTVTVDGRDMKASGYQAKKLAAALKSAGGGVTDGTVGADKSAATNVRCSRPAAPKPKMTCTLAIKNTGSN